MRGEVFLPRECFQALNKERDEEGLQPFANPRNAAAGTLKLLDPRAVARRGLDCYIHSALPVAGHRFDTDSKALEVLLEVGFKVVPHSRALPDIDAVIAYCDSWAGRRQGLPYDVDGMVVKVNRFIQRAELGETDRSPRWAVAYKYSPEQRQTLVRAIELNVGRTGVVTPVAVLDPVRLSGTTVTHSTLHNFEELRRLDVRVRDTVLVHKAGEIIPQILKVVKERRPRGAHRFRPPDACPACGGRLFREAEEVALRCVNASCPAMIKGRILHFASRSALDIGGLGVRLVDQLVERDMVASIADLYELTEVQLAGL